MLCCRAAVALSARVGGHVVGDNSRTRATPARVGRVRRTTLVTVAAATSDAASRRAALGALTLGGLSVAGFGALPPVAQAGLIDDLKAKKLASNAKFLLGPLRLSRNRLLEVAQLVDKDEPKKYAQARQELPRATLDCVTPSVGLQAFAQVRDVCTYSIVYRSVTKGPAAKNDEDSPAAKEAREALIALITALKAVDAVLESGEKGSADAKAALTPAFTKVFKLLDRFEMSIMNCLGYDRDLNMVLA